MDWLSVILVEMEKERKQIFKLFFNYESGKRENHTKTNLLSSVVGLKLAKLVIPKHATVIDVTLERGNFFIQNNNNDILEKQ